MDTTTAISNKDALLILLKDISLSANLQKSRDSILLAEDQYPKNLDPIFSKSDSATDLNHTLGWLKWNRKSDRALLDSGVYERMVSAQESLRTTLQLTPTVDNPWEKHTFKDWKHRVTNICLQAVQKAKRNVVLYVLVATVQTQFLAGAVYNSHQHCIQYSSYKCTYG
jgi:hypothetical protein